ncbi:MAG: beta-ketoacyl-[acyl-carrier-protein] synthase family protein [Salinivirgaceae bacterium]|nr:beta-ketoacyl-[acyl-carrier-protein] synthase family protein [Salinivirgaceae bacterium]
MEQKRVVITGIGVVASNGTGIPEFLDSIRKGKSGIRFLPELRDLNFACQVGGIPDISQPKSMEVFSQYQIDDASYNLKYITLSAIEAWNDAGLVVPDFIDSDTDYDTGIVIGSAVGNIDVFANVIIPKILNGNVRRLGSKLAEYSMFNSPSATIGSILALGNKNSANSSACSTGNESIIEGYERINEGKAKRMLVGSCEIPSPHVWGCFDSMRLLARKYNDQPEIASRPMSASANGFVPSAGGGVLVLEELETALHRNAKIYGEILGSHINSGGQRDGGTMQAPGSLGVQKCIKNAIIDSGISSKNIDYICGHLSSTMADSLEIKNWCEVLNRYGDDFPYINSLKSMTGHNLGSAGTIETISAILQMHYGFIHPSLNCEDLHPEIQSLISVSKIPQKTVFNTNINIFAKASFGFGDINSCIIIGKFKK